MTGGEVRALLRTVDAGALREQAGIGMRAMARALRVSQTQIWRWENGHAAPAGAAGARYARVIAGLKRHLEVTW